MKARHFLLGAIPFLMLPACVNDKDDGPTAEHRTTAKIRINIVSDNGVVSRAGETYYVDGSGDENDITSAAIVFYDSKGNPLQRVIVNNSNTVTNNESPYVELVKTIETEVSLVDGIYPSYIMVYANPITAERLSFSLNEINSAIRSTYVAANGKFSMNNAVYYDADGKLQREVPVTKENFYQTDEEKASAAPVTVYLERMAAKVTLKASDGSGLGTQSGELDGKQLVFNVTGWGLDACSKYCYLTKCFLQSDGSRTPFTTWNETLTSFEWNDPAHHRSYWATSPFYDLDDSNFDGVDEESGKTLMKYPWVSDQVSYGNILNYNSFDNIENKIDGIGASVGGSLYAMENTHEAMTFNTADVNTNAAIASAIVTGYYTLDGETVDFYVYGNKIYLEADFLKAMAALSSVIVKADDTPLTNDDNLSSIFEICHPKEPLGSDKSKGVEENKVSIKFKDTPDNLKNYKFKKSANTSVEITSGLVDEINEELMSQCGLASMYKEGKAYFYVPIRHLGHKSDPNDPTEAWPAGSFGLVRNHAYVINVDGFADLDWATLGNGVRDPEDPIVPPSDPNEKFGIKADVRVLSWRIVNQNVTLGKK